MIDYVTIRNKIVSGLYKHLNHPIVPADQTANRPPYPFVTYKFVSLYTPEPGFKSIHQQNDLNPDADITQVYTEQPTMVLSLTAISKQDIDSADLAQRIRDWFTIQGYDYLKELNIVVVEATAINDRSTLMIDEYEVKYGFDVRIRVLDKVTLTKSRIVIANTNRVE